MGNKSSKQRRSLIIALPTCFICLATVVIYAFCFMQFTSKKNNKNKYPFNLISSEDKFVINTMTYNIFSRWTNVTGWEGQAERLNEIPFAIEQFEKSRNLKLDVITFNESWCSDTYACDGRDKSRNNLKKSLQKIKFFNFTNILGSKNKLLEFKATSGGVFVASRHPIEKAAQYIFKNGAGFDKAAAKGVIYVRIRKNGQVYNIFALHTQAWSNLKGQTIREKQFKEIVANFIPTLNIPEDGSEAVIFQGDMNVDAIAYPQEKNKMLKLLEAKECRQTGSQLYTSDPSTNALVGKDMAANDNGCGKNYFLNLNKKIKTKCKSKNSLANASCTCDCCPFEKLDYVLFSINTKYKQPTDTSTEIIKLKSRLPLSYSMVQTYPGFWSTFNNITGLAKTTKYTGNDLSDHYPVYAKLVFARN